MGEPIDRLNCSFCGKNAKEVVCLIAGPRVFICGECVDLCVGIVADSREKRKLELAAEARGLAVVSKDDAERLAWMRTWTVAGEDRRG